MANSTIAALKTELKETRDASLEATRRGDFMKVARLTAKAAQLNKEILEKEGAIEATRVGAKPSEGLHRR